MLDLAHERARLVTVAACWSAATTANEQRVLLGIPLRDQNSDPERARQLSPATSSAPLATELASRLGYAVLAVRYPVDDEFAIELTTRSSWLSSSINPSVREPPWRTGGQQAAQMPITIHRTSTYDCGSRPGKADLARPEAHF